MRSTDGFSSSGCTRRVPSSATIITSDSLVAKEHLSAIWRHPVRRAARAEPLGPTSAIDRLPEQPPTLTPREVDQTTEARGAYERLRTVLATKLKMMPSAETQAVYAGLGAPGK